MFDFPEIFMAEPPPDDFVARPAEFERVVGAVLAPGGQGPAGNSVALHGAGGYGKTTLARAACWDERVAQAFPDGILWVTLGENPGQAGVLEKIKDLAEMLTGQRPSFMEIQPAAVRLRQVLRGRRALLVVDDAWKAEDLKPFLQPASRVVVLVTTRHDDILPEQTRRIAVDAMLPPEAAELLGKGAADPVQWALRGAEVQRLAKRLGEWPLLLKLANGVLRDLLRHGDTLDGVLRGLHQRLDRSGLTAFDVRSAEQREQAVERTLEISLQPLSPRERELFSRLAIFPEDAEISLEALKILWDCTRPQDEMVVVDLCRFLAGRSLLLRFDLKARVIRLHDVIRAYLEQALRKEQGVEGLHRRLVEGYWELYLEAQPAGKRAFAYGQDDGYYFHHLAYHLAGAGEGVELNGLLFDFDWLATRLRHGDINELILDYDQGLQAPGQARAELGLVQSALRLSAHLLKDDPRLLSAQLTGRLVAFKQPVIAGMLQQTRVHREQPWLRPLHLCLTPPGGAEIRTLKGHARSVNAVAITPDGRIAVSASDDRTLKVWDLDSGLEIRELLGHTGKVNGVAITPDGRHAVSASGGLISKDQILKVWDLENGQEIRELRGHRGEVNRVAITPDGRRAVSASDDQTLKVWDLESGQEIRTLRGHTKVVTNVAITPNGRRALSASWDRTLKVWDLESGLEIRELHGHTSRVNAAALTPDGRRVVSASNDGTVKVWDLESGQEIRELRGHTSEVRAVALTPDGRRVVSASNDGALKVWDLESGQEIRELHGHTGEVTAVALTPDGCRVVSASKDGTLKVWNLEGSQEIHEVAGHTEGINGVALTPDGRRAVTASVDHALKVWDLQSNQAVRELRGHTSEVHAVMITPDGRRAVSASRDRTVKVWDLDSSQEIRGLRGHMGWVNGVAITPDGCRAVSASWDESLMVWDLDSGQAIRELRGHTGPVLGVAITPDGCRAVSASWDESLMVWDLDGGQAICELRGHTKEVTAVALTPDGRHVVSASNDHTLKLWNLHSGQAIRELRGHTGPVLGVALAPDGRRVFSASNDNTLKAWDLQSGELLASFMCQGAVLCCAAGLRDGQVVVVAGDACGVVYFLAWEEGDLSCPAKTPDILP